jgi:hypothetical protein
MDESYACVAFDALHLASRQRVERHLTRVPDDANNSAAMNVDGFEAHEDGSRRW